MSTFIPFAVHDVLWGPLLDYALQRRAGLSSRAGTARAFTEGRLTSTNSERLGRIVPGSAHLTTLQLAWLALQENSASARTLGP